MIMMRMNIHEALMAKFINTKRFCCTKMEERDMIMKGTGSMMQDIFILIISAVVLVLFGLIFYLIDLWIIKFAAVDILGLSVSGDWIVLSAAILSAAAMIGGAGRKGNK
jgi:hypothetical protein